MKNSCSLYPLVGGELSKLYKLLLEKTGKDRKLTNLIYAICTQEDFIKKFGSPDSLNSQGQLKLDVVMLLLEVDKLISDKQKVHNDERSLGAVDDNGKTKYYTNVEDIYDNVMDYNDSHETVKAVIRYSSNGYYIEMQNLNAENFNQSNIMRIKRAEFDALQKLIESKGIFNTTFSPEAERAYNVQNVPLVIKTIRRFKTSQKYINPNMARFLLELLLNTPNGQRLIGALTFPDIETAAKAIAQHSSFTVDNPMPLNDTLKERLDAFITTAKEELGKISNSELQRIENDARANTSYVLTYSHTDGIALLDSLRELYKMYHIDLDNLNLLNARVNKISEAALKLLQVRLVMVDNLEKKQGKKARNFEDLLIRMQKSIDDCQYIDSIAFMLDNITKHLSLASKKQFLERKFKQMQSGKNKEDVTIINATAKVALEYLDMALAYKPILQLLANADLLENDLDDANVSMVNNILVIALELLNELTTLEESVRTSQYAIVYNFLKVYWGDDKITLDGTVTLDEIMSLASSDINMFDRYLYAVGTTSDEMMNLVGAAVKSAHRKRDRKLKLESNKIEKITKELYDSGSSTLFMFQLDKDGYPAKIASDYDYVKFERDMEEYRQKLLNDPSIKKYEVKYLVEKWKRARLKKVKLFGILLNVPSYIENGVDIYAMPTPIASRLTPALLKYYNAMMEMKAKYIQLIQPLSNDSLFDVIEIPADVLQTLVLSNGNPSVFFKRLGDKIKDIAKIRDNETTEYGDTYTIEEILENNGIVPTDVNAQGLKLHRLPLFYTHKIKDRRRVSTDFSKAMTSFIASSIQYYEMNNILDSLMMTKDWMLNVRPVLLSMGNKIPGFSKTIGRHSYFSALTKLGANTDLGGLTEDYYERVIFGEKKKPTVIWGHRIDAMADSLTAFTSITGLSVNVLGALANLFVGKLQMLIDAGCGEFFNIKDYAYADAKYTALLPKFLSEINALHKTSLLHLLMEEFNVTDDFYEKIKESGFYKNPISRIMSNTSLFFLYGLGEHMLHALTMLAVLHNVKVYDSNGNKVSIISAFDLELSEKEADLIFKKGYSIDVPDGANTKRVALTMDVIRDTKLYNSNYKNLNSLKSYLIGRIAYCNRTMHGAFGDDEKGMLHRYAFGRLIMNFRQWMPAHYGRRFRGMYYDADLDLYREGYYISASKFMWALAKDLPKFRFQWMTHWKELDEMQLYNCKRAFAEVVIMGLLYASVACLGDIKDRKGNWAYRDLVYQLKRMLLETLASSPLNTGFLSNIITVLNSPAACINTINKLISLLKLTDLFETIESGEYEGENRYFHNIEKDLPIIGLIRKQMEMDEKNDMFKIFDD